MTRAVLKSLMMLAVTLALPGLFAPAHAAYPEKPIKIVVGFTPGGTADSVARMLAVSMGARLGQTMIVENRPGANGVLATDFVARSLPDGYTIFFHLDRARRQPVLVQGLKIRPS